MRLKTLLVSGTSKDNVGNTRLILSNLRKNCLDVRWEWEIHPHQETNRHQIPSDCDFVLLLKDYLKHDQANSIIEQAKKRNIKLLRTNQRWSTILPDLISRGIIDSEEEIKMGATPEKPPEALVVGGRLEDRGEILSRMLKFGWRVREHWLSGEGGHEYSKPKSGIKLVIVLRDTLDNKQYQQAHTLADLSRVPIIKWDVNRELFRRRLDQQGLIYTPVNEVLFPVPPEAIPMSPKMTEVIQDIIRNGPQSGALETPTYRSVTATSSLDSLVAASKHVIEELHTNPLFRGVTIKVKDDHSVEILPIARPYNIVGGVVQPVDTADLKSVPEKVEGSSPSAPTPPPRPVAMPSPPKIVPLPEKPAKPTIVEVRGRGKGHLKGRKLLMDCRYPGCKARSGGPRHGFMCAAHQNIPEKTKKEYQKVFNLSHTNP